MRKKILDVFSVLIIVVGLFFMVVLLLGSAQDESNDLLLNFTIILSVFLAGALYNISKKE